MDKVKIARRYAKALFECSAEQGKLELVERNVKDLDFLYQSLKGFQLLVASPTVSLEEKENFFSFFFKKNQKVEELVASFVRLLLKKKRIDLLKETIWEFYHLVDKLRNEAVATVESTEHLSKGQKRKITSYLEKKFQKKIRIINIVAPSIRGGLRIFVEGKLIDLSVETYLNQLKLRLALVNV